MRALNIDKNICHKACPQQKSIAKVKGLVNIDENIYHKGYTQQRKTVKVDGTYKR